jgi:hypothetical protein
VTCFGKITQYVTSFKTIIHTFRQKIAKIPKQCFTKVMFHKVNCYMFKCKTFNKGLKTLVEVYTPYTSSFPILGPKKEVVVIFRGNMNSKNFT